MERLPCSRTDFVERRFLCRCVHCGDRLDFVGKGGVEKYLHKKWRLFTTDVSVAKSFATYTIDPYEATRVYAQCRGAIARASACYPPLMAQTFWGARTSRESAFGGCSRVSGSPYNCASNAKQVSLSDSRQGG